MALYLPAGQRRRRIIVAAAVALVVGLVVGTLVGRSTAPSVDDRISSARSAAESAEGRLAALPNEYAKQLDGSAQFAAGGGVGDALRQTRIDLDHAIADAPWQSAAQARRLRAAVDGLVRAAQTRVPAAQFDERLASVRKLISDSFGSAGSPG